MTRQQALDHVSRDVSDSLDGIDALTTEELYLNYTSFMGRMRIDITPLDIFGLCVFGQAILARALELVKTSQTIPDNATDPEAVTL